MSKTIRLQRVYPYSIEKLWFALTDREALAAWFMENDFELEQGREFHFRTDPAPGFDGVVNCQVLHIEAPRELAFSWRGGPIDTVVRLRLEEVAGGVLLTMEQSGFRGLKGRLIGWMLESGARRMYVRRLPWVLARIDEHGFHPDREHAPAQRCWKPKANLIGRMAQWLR